MIFVDSNVPMYLVGAAHPNKTVARTLLESAIARGDHLVTDVEVLQDVLHRYVAIDQPDAIGPAFEAILGVVDEVYPVELEDVERARRLLGTVPRLSARDALHLAMMRRRDVDTILTFDRAFDDIAGVMRMPATD